MSVRPPLGWEVPAPTTAWWFDHDRPEALRQEPAPAAPGEAMSEERLAYLEAGIERHRYGKVWTSFAEELAQEVRRMRKGGQP